MTYRRSHGRICEDLFRVARCVGWAAVRSRYISLLAENYPGAAREFGVLELSLGRGEIFWYKLLTDEVLTLTVIASGLRAGSLLRAAE